MTTGRSQTLVIGILGRPHGVRGAIAFRPYNPDTDLFEKVEPPFSVCLQAPRAGAGKDTDDREAVVTSVRPAGDRYLLQFKGFDDREAAARLTNSTLSVERHVLGPVSDDEYYVEDLVGCRVFDQDGQPRGEIASLFSNGAHQVLQVLDQGRETLLPLVPAYTLQIDTIGRRVQMTFLEDTEAEAEEAEHDEPGDADRS